MSRRPSASNLPTPAPKNISNREYYTPCSTSDATDADVEYPSPRTSSEVQHRGAKTENEGRGLGGIGGRRSGGIGVDEDGDAVVVVAMSGEDGGSRSSSPSDVVLGSDLRDVEVLSALDEEMRGRGVGRAERKGKLLELRGKRAEEREEKSREAQRQREIRMEREYEEMQRRGREEV